MFTVTIHEAKATLSKLIEDALSGEEIIIARRNKPLDRMIIAQALYDNVPVLSSDSVFAEYGVRHLF